MQIPKPSAVTCCLPGAGVALQWQSRGRCHLPEPHLAPFARELSEKKGSEGRSGRVFQYMSLANFSWHLWVLEAQLIRFRALVGRRGMRAADKRGFVSSVNPVESAWGFLQGENSLTPWSHHSEGRETPNKALCSPCSRV